MPVWQTYLNTLENQRTTIQSQSSDDTMTSSVSGSIGVQFSGFYSPTQGSTYHQALQICYCICQSFLNIVIHSPAADAVK